MRCNTFYPIDKIINSNELPICDKCGGLIKPDVVLYEESLNENDIYKAIDLISNAEVLIVLGTSLRVYPASGFINYYRNNKLVLINRDPTDYDYKANLLINDSLKNVFEKIKI